MYMLCEHFSCGTCTKLICIAMVMLQVRFSKGDDSMPSGKIQCSSIVITISINCNLFSEEIRAQLIDTTLLKCYIKVSNGWYYTTT